MFETEQQGKQKLRPTGKKKHYQSLHTMSQNSHEYISLEHLSASFLNMPRAM